MGETEAEGGAVTCFRSHRELVAELWIDCQVSWLLEASGLSPLGWVRGKAGTLAWVEGSSQAAEAEGRSCCFLGHLWVAPRPAVWSPCPSGRRVQSQSQVPFRAHDIPQPGRVRPAAVRGRETCVRACVRRLSWGRVLFKTKPKKPSFFFNWINNLDPH